MMTRAGVGLLVGLTLLPTTSIAQGRGKSNKDSRRATQGIPPGHLPPPGECRVWIDGRPPGQQPPSTDCQSARITASRTPYGRVIYGDRRPGAVYRDDTYRDDRRPRDDDRRSDDRRGTGRAIPRDDRDQVYRDEYPQGRRTPDDRYPDRRNSDHPGWVTGYRDGLVKGREDASKNRSYDPNRHQWYRSASRGYERRYGLRGAYVTVYREGFENGYAEEFRRLRSGR